MVLAGAADIGLGWVPKVLAANERGANLVNIAQISQRSGSLQVSFADAGIESVEDLRGMRVGAWGFGNEHESSSPPCAPSAWILIIPIM